MCVCVFGSKSHSGCLPIIMMLLNPSLKLTLLSFSLVLYPFLLPPSFSLPIALPLFYTPALSLSHFLNAQLTTPPRTPSPCVSFPRCIISEHGSLLALQKPLGEISSRGARLLSLSLSSLLSLSFSQFISFFFYYSG